MNSPTISAHHDDLFDRLANLRGLVSRQLGESLAALASNVPHDKAIVELGSYKGKSTCYLAAGALLGHGAHVWAFDPWDLPGNETGRHLYADPATREAFHAQVAAMGYRDRITATRAFATVAAAAWNGPPVALLYIDSDHRAKSVRADFTAWRPLLAPGAVVAFDDYGTPKNPGVADVVDDLAAQGLIHDVRIAAEHLAISRLS